ncbi:Dabb family protein [Paludibacteraceae bacterium OttesenSCG-928-F17]|nr:Dabb family protein [Paludibacteraceae bacterium OttesenSCG-928-F17]
MLKHIVFFRLADEAEGKTKAENAGFIKEELENLIHHIPVLRKIEVGINSAEAPQSNYDLVLYSEFDSFDDLDIYQKHPEHQKVVAYINKVRIDRAAVDYEI